MTTLTVTELAEPNLTRSRDAIIIANYWQTGRTYPHENKKIKILKRLTLIRWLVQVNSGKINIVITRSLADK